MANDEVLGPRKTMFVLVIVVGCFAVLWPRILSPLLAGGREQLKPNQFDRDAGCCEVLFASEMAVLELVTEVCNSAVGTDGRRSVYAVNECRKSLNDTCGVDIAAFLKRKDNVGKSTKVLLESLQSSNSSCLRENFGVNVWSVSPHVAVNSWQMSEMIKQERPPIRGSGPHPALKERGRAIPPGAPTPPSRGPVPLPPHVRVRSPLQGYYEVEVQPPPIPGMRPPLGSPGGPVAAPKSSMGLVMPIYTICIIVFFVYTLSKILFKRTGTVPYDQVQSDPQFRRRVFRDDSRASPDNKFVVTAISGLVAEVQQQMEASYAQSQQRQEAPDNNARPYTNGTVPNADNAPVRIVATEYVEPSREKTPEAKEKESTPEIKEPSPEKTQPAQEEKEPTPEEKETTPDVKESTPEEKEPTPESKEPTPEKEASPEPKQSSPEQIESEEEEEEELEEEKDESPEPEKIKIDHKNTNGNAIKHADVDVKKSTESFLDEARDAKEKEEDKKQSTPELLEEALQESEEEVEEIEEVEEEEEEEDEDEEVAPSENSAVKHSAEDVKSIYLQTEIPQQSKVLVADFAQGRPTPAEKPGKRAPLVVSGKMTLSLIQDAPRETPERDAESTVDDFTTASAMTQHAENNSDDYSEEEVEEEVEEEELEEDEEAEDAPGNART